MNAERMSDYAQTAACADPLQVVAVSADTDYLVFVKVNGEVGWAFVGVGDFNQSPVPSPMEMAKAIARAYVRIALATPEGP